MTKAKLKHTKSKRKEKHQAKPRKKKTEKIEAQNSDCPYRAGTLYEAIFVESNRGYKNKNELLKKVSEKTGKPLRSVEFGYQVLKSKTHKSNGGRSCELEEGNQVKLIAIRKPSTE